MSQTTTGGGIPPFVNQTMKFVLASPIHGIVSKTILLLTFTGRRSGRTYTTPVSYSQYGDQVVVFTHAGWWKNLCGCAPVTLRIRGRELQGLAEAVADDKEAVAAALTAHLRNAPFDARYYDVTFDADGNPNAGEAAEAAQSVVMIRIQLC